MKQTSIKTGLRLLILSLLACTTTTGADFGYPPVLSLDAIRKQIDQAHITHPRLLTNGDGFAELRQSLDKDPLRRGLADAVVRQAEKLLKVAPIKREQQEKY